MPIHSKDYPSAANAVETADANPGEQRTTADEVTVTITLSRAFVIEQLKHDDDATLAGLLRNELYRATRA